MNDVYQTMETYFLARRKYQRYVAYQIPELEKMMRLYDDGYCYALAERDAEGQRIVFLQTRKMDPDLYTVYDSIHLLCFVGMVLLEEEETQIAGISVIIDHSEAKMKHFMSPVDMRDFMDFFINCNVSRQKEIYIINLPSIAHFLLEIFKMALKEKLRKRIFLPNDMKDLKNYVNPALIPKDHGGTGPSETEMMAKFRVLVKEKSELLKKIYETEILWDKVPSESIQLKDDEIVGSFRKLEID